MALLYGTIDGGFIVEAEPVPTGFEPVYGETAAVAPFWRVIDDGYALMGDKGLIERTWEGAVDVAAGDLLRTHIYDATTSLASTPVLSQRRWVNFDLTRTVDFSRGSPLSDVDGFVWSSTYGVEGALRGTWKNRPESIGPSLDLRGAVTERASLRWSFRFEMQTLQRGAIALIGYSGGTNWSEGALLAGVSRLTSTSSGNTEQGWLTLVHVGAEGEVVYGISGDFLQPHTDYRIDVQYVASTKILSATAYAVRGSKFTASTGLTDDALGDLPFTNVVHVDGADFSAIAAGDIVVYGGQESRIVEVVGEYLSVESYIFPAEASNLSFAVVGPVSKATAVLEVQSQTPDSAHRLTRFGASSFDITQLTENLYGNIRDALGKFVIADTWDWVFSDPSSPLRIREIPLLQDLVRAPTATWVGGVDFHLSAEADGTVFEFPSVPNDRVWAEYVAYDERLLSDIYGANVGVVGDSSEDYKTRLRGLYFSYFRGPTRAGIRTGVHLLLGLPVADVAGEVEELEVDFTGLLTRIRVAGRDYTFPKSVGTTLQVGDDVEQFQPLCRGVEVVDWRTDPYWWTRHSRLHELQKFHTFELQAETEAPDLKGLPFALSFIRNISPTWKQPFFSAVTRVDDDVAVSDDILLAPVLRLWDTLCDHPIPRYDSHDYSPDVTDWRYDQVEGPEWSVTAGIQRHPRYDGVKDYLTDLTGLWALENGETTATSIDGDLVGEVGAIGAVSRKYVAASRFLDGAAGVTTAGGLTFVDATAGAFDDVVAGAVLHLVGASYRVVAVDGDELTLDAPTPASATGLTWVVVNEAFLRGQVASVTAAGELEFAEPFTGEDGDYVLSLIDLEVMNVYYDREDEICPEEGLDIEATLSVGYGETLLQRGVSFVDGSDIVSGWSDAVSHLGPLGPVSGHLYISDPEGRWHRVVNISSSTEVSIETPATSSSPSGEGMGWVSWKAKPPLAGTLDFTNGSATVTCTDDQSASLSAGDFLQAVPALGATPLSECPVVEVLAVAGDGLSLTLTDVYAGTTRASTKAIRRGPGSMFPKAIDLPVGREPADVVSQEFTEFQPGAGSRLESTVVEPTA